jgi:hypothetical protein
MGMSFADSRRKRKDGKRRWEERERGKKVSGEGEGSGKLRRWRLCAAGTGEEKEVY